jgi:hypothetical protein
MNSRFLSFTVVRTDSAGINCVRAHGDPRDASADVDAGRDVTEIPSGVTALAKALFDLRYSVLEALSRLSIEEYEREIEYMRRLLWDLDSAAEPEKHPALAALVNFFPHLPGTMQEDAFEAMVADLVMSDERTYQFADASAVRARARQAQPELAPA